MCALEQDNGQNRPRCESPLLFMCDFEPLTMDELRQDDAHGIFDGCGSCEVSWLRCDDEALAVSGVVDAFVLAAEVEAPVGVEVATDRADPYAEPSASLTPSYRRML
jgi:hypothetical protein